MSATTTAGPHGKAAPHSKTWGLIGQHTLERCEAPRATVVTRAETAECTCPEACERDHEWD